MWHSKPSEIETEKLLLMLPHSSLWPNVSFSILYFVFHRGSLLRFCLLRLLSIALFGPDFVVVGVIQFLSLFFPLCIGCVHNANRNHSFSHGFVSIYIIRLIRKSLTCVSVRKLYFTQLAKLSGWQTRV